MKFFLFDLDRLFFKFYLLLNGFQEDTNNPDVEEINNDEVLKGGAGGMERGSVEDTKDKNTALDRNVMDQKDENMEEK